MAGMQIQHIVLADYAEIVNGKLYLMGGGWNTFFAREVPVQMRIAVAVGVRIEWEETNRPIPVRVYVEDDDGKELARIEGTMQVGRPANLPGGSSQLSQMAVNLSLSAARYGNYRIRALAGEGEFAEESGVSFRVVERSAQ
jgi:hypothetical protein